MISLRQTLIILIEIKRKDEETQKQINKTKTEQNKIVYSRTRRDPGHRLDRWLWRYRLKSLWRTRSIIVLYKKRRNPVIFVCLFWVCLESSRFFIVIILWPLFIYRFFILKFLVTLILVKIMTYIDS